MAVVEEVVPAPIEDVFDVLADGWTYSDWVVGTAHIRDVDPSWPAAGARIHHKVGMWPVFLQDSTVVLRSERPTMLIMQPKLRPLGEVRVTIRLADAGGGRTRVTFAEDFAAGPLRWMRTKVHDLVLHHRNRESLRRLADIAVGRHR